MGANNGELLLRNEPTATEVPPTEPMTNLYTADFLKGSEDLFFNGTSSYLAC